MSDFGIDRGGEGAAGPKGGKSGFVSRLRKRVGEKHGLSLGAAAA